MSILEIGVIGLNGTARGTIDVTTLAEIAVRGTTGRETVIGTTDVTTNREIVIVTISVVTTDVRISVVTTDATIVVMTGHARETTAEKRGMGSRTTEGSSSAVEATEVTEEEIGNLRVRLLADVGGEQVLTGVRMHRQVLARIGDTVSIHFHFFLSLSFDLYILLRFFRERLFRWR